jgi:2-dehydropantoate 2-reductase
MNNNRKKIAIFGAGAMGTVLGALLTKSGADVTLITRNKSHVDGLNKQGARILCTPLGKEWKIPVHAITPQEMQEKYDLIFLMTKQRENMQTAEFLLNYLREDGIVCTTQNGLPEQKLSEILTKEKTYGAVMSWGATFVGGGAVELTSVPSAMTIEVGGYQNDNAYTPLLVEILSYASKVNGNENFAKAADNLLGARWSKLAINAAFSGLSVVTGLTFGEVATKRKTRKLALKVLRECIDVAKAHGVKLAKMQGNDMEKLLGGKTALKRFIAYLVLPFAMKKHKKLVSGMLKDLQNGRKCEIDFINGAVVRAGQAVGAETPINAQIVQLTRDIENGLCEITYKNTDLFC